MWPGPAAPGTSQAPQMSDVSHTLVGLASDAAVKLAALVLVADLLTRGLNRSAPPLANRLWLVVLSAGALLPVIGWLTQAAVLIEPSAGVLNRVPTGLRTPSWTVFAAAMLASGALVFLVRITTGLAAIRRLVASSDVVSRTEQESLRRMAIMQSRRGDRCRFASNPSLSVPVTVGHWRPWVLLPADWRTWPAARLAAVMAHEGAHVDRGDYLAGIAAALVRALWWWHPAAWVAVSRLQLSAELACDARASAIESRADYAGHLLDLAQTAGGHRVRYGWTLGATSRLRERVDALLDEHPAAHRLAISVRAVMVAIAIALTCAAAPIRFTLSRATDFAPGFSFDHDAQHDSMHASRHNH